MLSGPDNSPVPILRKAQEGPLSEYGPKMMREVIPWCAERLDTYATVVVVAVALVVDAVVAVVA